LELKNSGKDKTRTGRQEEEFFTADGTDKTDKHIGTGKNHAVLRKMSPPRGFMNDGASVLSGRWLRGSISYRDEREIRIKIRIRIRDGSAGNQHNTRDDRWRGRRRPTGSQ